MKLIFISPFPPLRGGISKETETIYNFFKKNHQVNVISYKKLYPKLFFPGKTQYLNENKYKDNKDIVSLILAIFFSSIIFLSNDSKYVKKVNSDLKGLFVHWSVTKYTAGLLSDLIATPEVATGQAWAKSHAQTGPTMRLGTKKHRQEQAACTKLAPSR